MMREELIFKGDEIMNYQELVNKCKKAYKDNILGLSYKYWCDIHDILDKRLSEFDLYDDENRYKCYQEFNNYIKQFTDEEVFRITDYGKQKAYREMEREKSMEILNESISLYELTKDEKMKSLDEFLNFYEWCIIKSDDEENKYDIYDLQTNCIIDDESKTLDEVINRVVGRAVDYETNEVECDDEYIDDDIFRYYEDLYDIAKKYTIGENYDLWLKDFREFIDDFKRIAKDKKICLVCGKEKDDYQSAYCDECWEEEKKRLGVD